MRAPSRKAAILAKLLAGAWLLSTWACSSTAVTGAGKVQSDDGKDEEDDDGDDAEGGKRTEEREEGSDAPVWVNGASLTCDWNGAESSSEARVLCGLNDADGKPLKPEAKVPVAWKVLDTSNETADAEVRDTGSDARIERIFILESKSVAERTIQIEIGSIKPAAKKAKLAYALPGMNDDEFKECLQNEATSSCLGTLEEAATPGAEPLASLRIFVSSAMYNGNLGGVAGADSKCQGLATSAGLGNTWIAVVGGSSFPSKVPSGIAIKSVSGQQIFATLAQLGGVPATPLTTTESGGTTAGVAWTGLGADGFAPGATCSTWGSTSSTGDIGEVGDPDSDWLSISSTACNVPGHLYCLEVSR